jgi:hypothetical protein
VTHPFQVVVDTEADPPITLDAGTVQTPVIPKSATRVAMALLALAALLLAGWFLLLKPVVRSAAKDAVDKPLTQVAQQANSAGQKADTAKAKADEVAQKAASGGAAPGGGAPAATKSAAAGATTTTPTRVRLQTAQGASATPGTNTYTVPAKTTLVVTDLVMENPQGDTGRVDVLVDNTPILTLSLANFRDLDYHFVSAIEVPAGKTLAIQTTCQSPGPAIVGTAGGQCRVWMFATGVNRTAAP